MRKERELIMETRKSANIGARLDRLPNSGWHIKMWLVTAFALLVCWSNGIGGSVQNILLNELHWLEPGTKLLAMWGTTYTAGQLFGALVGGPIGDKIGRKKSILLYEIIHIIAMIGGAIAPNIYVLYVFRLVQGFGLGALLVVLFAGFTEYVPGRNRGVWSSRNSFIGNWAHPICNGIAFLIVTTGISYNMNWRIQYMIPSVLSIIASIIIAKKLPESPRWLEAQGRVDEADAILTKIEKEIEASTGKPLPPVTEEPKEVKQLPYSALFKGKLLRRRVLDGESMRDTVYNMITEYVENITDRFASPEAAAEDWDVKGLELNLHKIIPMMELPSEKECIDMRQKELKHLLKERAVKAYEVKEAEFPEAEQIRELERVVLLKVIDARWMDHIDDMDQLRQGIGLQAYGQRDPLVEYKMTGYNMFGEMTNMIAETTIRTLFNVRVEQKVEREEVAKVTGTNKDDTSVRAPKKREDKKVYPNDPCPCGSGKKYKQCCGRKPV